MEIKCVTNVEKLKARRLELQFEIDRAERHRSWEANEYQVAKRF